MDDRGLNPVMSRLTVDGPTYLVLQRVRGTESSEIMWPLIDLEGVENFLLGLSPSIILLLYFLNGLYSL